MSNPKNHEEEVDSAEFARILTKQAVAHVCVALGFTATTPGALECLTDVVQRYVEIMAIVTMENTTRAGRTEPNIADVLQGFQQLPTPLSWTELRDFAFSEDGFSAPHGSHSRNVVAGVGSSSSNGAIAAATAAGVAVPAAADIGVGAGGPGAKAGRVGGGRDAPKRWDQPFHHTVPPFPMPRKRRNPWVEAAERAGEVVPEGVRPPHIPDFMPPLPPSSRGRGASEGSGRSLAEIRLERLKRQRQGETALRSLGAPVAAAAAGSSGLSSATAAATAGVGRSSSGKTDGNRKLIIRLSSTGAGAVGSGGGGGGNGVANGASNTITSANGVGFDEGGGNHPGGRSRAGGNGGGGRTAGGGGFRSITPNAAGAGARLSASAGGGEDGASDPAAVAGGGGGGGGSVKARVLKGIAGGGRGAFGRSSDSTREDRILEGMPPDGTNDMESAA